MRPEAAAILAAGILVVSVAAALGQSEDLAAGRRVFEENCAVCHGTNGDGHGHAAHHFAAAPRDLTGGRYKIRSTTSGQPPTDADLKRTIAKGLPGTGMVPQDHLSEPELNAVITYIKSLSPKFAAVPNPAPLVVAPAPPKTPDAVARGRKVYDKAECYECHGRQARGDGPSAKDLKIKPSDLTRRPFKSGPAPEDIVRAILTGLDGTPMPSYHLILDDAELWDLAYYIDSLGGAPEVTADERAGWHVVRQHQKR
ncbi:MAG TPA: c-type cytochrome [Methylomirabilota bacterium]